MSDLFDDCPDGTYIDFPDDYINKIFKKFGLDKLFDEEE